MLAKIYECLKIIWDLSLTYKHLQIFLFNPSPNLRKIFTFNYCLSNVWIYVARFPNKLKIYILKKIKKKNKEKKKHYQSQPFVM